MNAMRQGKPKFEALNNCNSFELDWDRDSNNLLLTSSEEIYLYQQADKSWKESLIAQWKPGQLKLLKASFSCENAYIECVKL